MSAASFESFPPLFDKVEFHVHRLRAAAVGAAAIIAGGVIACPAVALRPSVAAAPESLAAGIALAGASALIATGTFVLLRLMSRHDPVVVVDAAGIHDRRTEPNLLPWSSIRDIRILDRHGRRIGIETLNEASDPAAQAPAARSGAPAKPITVIDTFFLRSTSGNRILDFIVPITAMAPIDLSETPVSEDRLSEDMRLSRRRTSAILIFLALAGIIPAAASVYLAIRWSAGS